MKNKRNLVTVMDDKNQKHILNLDMICDVRFARTGDTIYVLFVSGDVIGVQGDSRQTLLDAYQN